MYGRMATYNVSGDPHDLARKAEDGLLPILQAQQGFRSYTVSSGDGQILSLSAWDSRADAEAGRQRRRQPGSPPTWARSSTCSTCAMRRCCSAPRSA